MQPLASQGMDDRWSLTQDHQDEIMRSGLDGFTSNPEMAFYTKIIKDADIKPQ